MYKIKEIPEDFIVKEISKSQYLKNGSYSYYVLKKRDYTTLKAIETIAHKLGTDIKKIGFAGNKDRRAVTEQLISIYKGKEHDLNLKDISLRYIGKGDKPISLGDLEGNLFEITIRNLSNKDIKNLKENSKKELIIPNYFGEQRFSTNNYLIGKAIIKKDFKKAVELLIEHEKDNHYIKEYLEKNRNDYIGALRRINKKLLRLYVHSYESLLFNETIEQYLKLKIKNNEKIPIIGFGLYTKNKKIEKIINNILKKEQINPRDFIISQMPELSSEGGERDLFIKVKYLKLKEVLKDELNSDKQKAVVSFSLPKACYATIVIKNLLQQ